MASINVKTTVTAPAEINIPLVRADHAITTNIFRVFFEVFLSLFSSVFGYVLALEKTTPLHWIFLSVMGIAALAFGISACLFSRKARQF